MTDVPTRLVDPEEVLRRQVHPSQLNTLVGLQKGAFLPKKDEDGQISTLRGHVDPDEAYRRHTEIAKRESVGTWGVSVGQGEGLGVSSWSDECLPDTPPDHAAMDFSDHPSNNQRIRVAKKLRDLAVARGCLYAPPVSD